MRLLESWEPVQIRIAIANIVLGSIPQIFIAKIILGNIIILDRAFSHPLTILLLYSIPGILWRKFCISLACGNMSKEDKEFHIETWYDSTPKLFWIPLFQVHSGILYLIRILIVVIGRFLIAMNDRSYEPRPGELWRSSNPYVFFDQSEY